MMIGDGLSGPEATDRLLKEWMPSSEKDPDAAAIVGVIAWSIRGDVKDIFLPRLEGETFSCLPAPVRKGRSSVRLFCGSCMVPSQLHPC
jgi:hypothetical protein